jgi:hypothetical protein
MPDPERLSHCDAIVKCTTVTGMVRHRVHDVVVLRRRRFEDLF